MSSLIWSGLVSFLFTFHNTTSTNYTIREHKFNIKGSSTLHDWSIQVSKVSGQAVISTNSGKIEKIESLKIDIPVYGLLSSNKSEMMDNKAHEALKKTHFPIIEFQLQQIKSLSQEHQYQNIQASGLITIAGSKKLEDLSVKALCDPNGSIKFMGSKKIYMTDYNIKPPKAMMNTLSTGNEVTIEFEIVLNKF